MATLFSRPKPPKIELPKESEAPPAPLPPLPPPAKEAPEVQGAEAEVRRKERRRGRAQTVLANPLGQGGANPQGPKTLVGQ